MTSLVSISRMKEVNFLFHGRGTNAILTSPVLQVDHEKTVERQVRLLKGFRDSDISFKTLLEIPG